MPRRKNNPTFVILLNKKTEKKMKAFVFPGQGAQFIGMGEDLYKEFPIAKEYFDKANEILGFNITEIMFDGTLEELKETRITQPAIFIHSVISALVREESDAPDMVAGHSLGEFSALVIAKALSFEDGLKLVYARALAMQKACEIEKSTMAAVLSLEDEIIEEVCAEINKEFVVVPANYNCPGQVVISGSLEGIDKACEVLTERGAKRALRLQVSGAFHSPMMNSAKEELKEAIDKVTFNRPICPIYQNVDAQPHTDPNEIKENIIAQLTNSVRWTQTVENMIENGATHFYEYGPGDVLKGLIKKINEEVEVN